MTAIYRIVTLGDVAKGLPSGVRSKIEAAATSFGLNLKTELEFVGPDAGPSTAASVAIYIGGAPPTAFTQQWLIAAGIPVIPLVAARDNCAAELPSALLPINAMSWAEDSEDTIAAAILECLGLLHRQRRVFISYVRREARSAALQLFDQLSERQFDVFLDTHDVRPGEDFQAVLWHRLCDSDVMLMLDTANYFSRRWTREEYGKASLKKAAILRVAWPGVAVAPSFSATDTIELDATEFSGDSLSDPALGRIGGQIEHLRSLSIAARHANLVGTLRAAVDDLKGKVVGIGARRRVDFDLPRGKRIHAYSVLGVPTSQTLHEVAIQAAVGNAAIVYDHLGVHDRWVDHLKWLGANISSVRWLQTAQLAWDLAAWDSE